MALFIPFIDSSPSFTLGFEAGEIFALCSQNITIDKTIHIANEEQLKTILEAFNYNFNFMVLNSDWAKLKAKPKENKPNQRSG